MIITHINIHHDYYYSVYHCYHCYYTIITIIIISGAAKRWVNKRWVKPLDTHHPAQIHNTHCA